jgi:hypothetical protein
VDQSRDPERDGQKQKHPSDQDSDAERDDRHPRFCDGERPGYSDGMYTQAERKTITSPAASRIRSPSMRSDQPCTLVRYLPAGFRGRSRIRRTISTLAPRRSARTMPILPTPCPIAQPIAVVASAGKPSHLRRHDVDLAVEDRDQQGQDAVGDRSPDCSTLRFDLREPSMRAAPRRAAAGAPPFGVMPRPCEDRNIASGGGRRGPVVAFGAGIARVGGRAEGTWPSTTT